MVLNTVRASSTVTPETQRQQNITDRGLGVKLTIGLWNKSYEFTLNLRATPNCVMFAHRQCQRKAWLEVMAGPEDEH